MLSFFDLGLVDRSHILNTAVSQGHGERVPGRNACADGNRSASARVDPI